MTPIHILSESFQFRMDTQIAMEQVARQIGYPKIPSDRQVKAMIQSIIQEGNDKIRVDFVYKEDRITDWAGPSIVTESILVESLRWSELVRHMETPQRVCAFVITLGSQFDLWIQQLQKQSLFDAYIADAFGSVCIESAADQLSIELEKQYARIDLECSSRLSPGYCDWRLACGQKAVFQFLQPENIGLSCRSTGLMVPLKTISAVFFAGKRVLWKTPCVFCNDRTCRHRREEPSKVG
jgi:hypothetical protein